MDNSIYKTVLVAMVIVMFLVLCSFSLKEYRQNQNEKKAEPGFAVLELFTSQGCSSCPPADEVLATYAALNNPKIIPLAFHVDYWNYIGWKDPFSKAQFSNRQHNYERLLHVPSNYTPQLIINGTHELVGSNKNAIKILVDQQLKVPSKNEIRITKAVLVNNQLKIDFDTDALANTVVNLAVVKKKSVTNIKRGENSGLQQTNFNIVFDFITVPNDVNAKREVTFNFNPQWSSTDFTVVAYLQKSDTGAILTASQSEIFPKN
ncbi:DUF1223 domain-containing protein [Flavobacterium sp.]|uniref:DUF1223 domain-containing protein n=1 Tax=Flavobacterium sp. TaxID=239 RepID=UPI003B9B481D